MTAMRGKWFGAIEAGGTKFICAVGKDQITHKARFDTGSPSRTLAEVEGFFREQVSKNGPLCGIGIGSFGPINIDPSSPEYGVITTTPKPGWSGVNLVRELGGALESPVTVDTDVNCALMGEHLYGAARGCDDAIYVTIGTGIGGGVLSNGRIVLGSAHPEIGHIFIPKDEADHAFAGICPYHQDRCIEGLASGPAIEARWGAKASQLPEGHSAWAFQARYIAKLCHNLLMTTAPRKIILGGGVMEQKFLFALIRQELTKVSNFYGVACSPTPNLVQLVVATALGGDAGIIGAFELARMGANGAA